MRAGESRLDRAIAHIAAPGEIRASQERQDIQKWVGARFGSRGREAEACQHIDAALGRAEVGLSVHQRSGPGRDHVGHICSPCFTLPERDAKRCCSRGVAVRNRGSAAAKKADRCILPNDAMDRIGPFELKLNKVEEPQSLTFVESTLNEGVVTMAAKEKTLNDLFLHTLKDIYYAEKQILKALPRMAKNAESEELRQAFETHREETEGQIERLEKVFEMLGKPARGVQCEAINGIIEEGKEVMEDFADSEALDAGILAAAQAVEHYEITRYGSLKTWAQELGMDDAAKLLDQNLQEEKKTDKLLTDLAEARVNTKAA